MGMRQSFIGSIFAVAALSGCQTPAYKPMEYSVPVTRNEARAALVEQFSAYGYRVANDTDFSLTLTQQQTAGEAMFVNRQYFYQFTVTGDKPATVLPRIIMSQGREPRVLTIDVTDRAELRTKLESQLQPVISKLGGRKVM